MKKLFILLFKPLFKILEESLSQLGSIIKTSIKSFFSRLKFSISFRISFAYFRLLLRTYFLLIFIVSLLYVVLISPDIIDKYKSYLLQAETWLASDRSMDISLLPNQEQEEDFLMIFDANKDRIYSTDKTINRLDYSWSLFFKNSTGDIYFTFNDKVTRNNQPSYIKIYLNINKYLFNLFVLLCGISLIDAIRTIIIMRSGGKENKKVLLPIREMTDTANNITANNLSLRLNVEGAKDELKDLAKTINQMMERIEMSYNNQKEFVSDASHELRTPISVIQGYANMLDRWGKNDPAILQESITAIKNESENMQDLVEKLLFLARHDKKTFVMEEENFNTRDLLDEMIKETKMIDQHHIIHKEMNTDIVISADKNRIKQAIRVFIDNAVKYTPKGNAITIKNVKENGYSVISIIDTGMGISKEQLNRIFDRFYRTDESRSKIKNGHGLGLSIAKLIILSHGGKIKVRSKIGKGTEFHIYLPIQ